MKLTLIPLLITSTILMQGCGSSDSTSSASTSQTKKENTLIDIATSSETASFFSIGSWNWSSDLWNWWNSDSADTAAKESLTQTLYDIADRASSIDEFTKDGLKATVEYVVSEYFSLASSYLLAADWGPNDDEELYMYLYNYSESLRDYMNAFYNSYIKSSDAPQRAAALSEQKSLLDQIIEEIFNILSELMQNFFSSSNNVAVPDLNNSIRDIDPNQSFTFTQNDIEDKKYYVASQQYMNVTFSADGTNGYGDIGYGIGADFNSSISGGELFIDMSGIYEVSMLYKDPGYCMATEMTDTSDGTRYPAYWFVDESIYNEATDLSKAKTLCYAHAIGFAAPVVATDGVLEPIKDERVGHSPVSRASTSTMVNELVDGVDNVATPKDAKYFAREMRHGIFSIYTTNNQTDTLQATETKKITRELLPLAASSALGMQELMGNAYDETLAFQTEVNRDLNNSTTEVNDRLDAIISATSQAMDRTTSSNGYHGVSDTTLFGDIVDFKATNIQSSCGVAFFLCNEATADVTMKITNPENNGIDADVLFTTKVTTSIIGNSAVDFSQVNTNQPNYLSGVDYRLNINDFNYQRDNGLMSIKGDGYLGNSLKSLLSFNKYDILATFTETPSLALVKFSATVDGNVTTKEGREFTGILVFDGDNTSNTEMDGLLKGINTEPIIRGVIKTSLKSEDITAWVASHDGLNSSDVGDLNSIGNQSYSMKVQITKDDKKASADMLVKRDDALKSWTYMLKDLNVSDPNGEMYANTIYFIQNGDNTLVQTLNKVALDGIASADMNSLINIGWDIASDFDHIGVEGLSLVMKPASGDVKVKSTIHVTNNNDATMSADINATYDYDTTHLTTEGNFTTQVDASSGENVYTNEFSTKGAIKVDNLFNYLYEIEYTDLTKYMLFTRKDITYQMGFIIDANGIKGGDSYGVVADFVMNESYDVLESMKLRNTDENPLGIYNRSENPLQIIFADDVKEYMYLY